MLTTKELSEALKTLERAFVDRKYSTEQMTHLYDNLRLVVGWLCQRSCYWVLQFDPLSNIAHVAHPITRSLAKPTNHQP